MVKKGYKETEAGVIPDDWACICLGNYAKIYRGGSPRPIFNYITTASDGVNWIKIGDVESGDKYINATKEKIIPSGVKMSRTVSAGDFILSNSMSFGRPYILNIDGCIHDGWLTIQDYQQTYDRDFLYYLLSSELVFEQYTRMASGSSVKNLNKEKVSNLMLPLLPITEQKKIANALSDIDNVISSLEKLIEKKKAIKQACLQKMFPKEGETVPEMRIKGFAEPWKQCKLGELAVISKGQQINRDSMFDDGPYYVLNGGTAPSGYTQNFNTEANVISISEGGNSCGFVNYNVERFWSGGHNYTLSEVKCNTRFLYQLLKSKQSFIMSLRVGSGLPNVQKNRLSNEVICLYPSKEEQEKIAKFFDNLDSIISVHQRKLEKCKKIKQGMMEQLLSGKVRLK